MSKPDWLIRFESSLANAIPVHANTLSASKMLIITPVMLLALRQVDVLPGGAAIVSVLFLVFAALDYLDGVVARGRGQETWLGRVFDRLTDYPLLLAVSYFSLDILPIALIATKLAIDLLLLFLYALGRGSTENRLRTTLSYTTVLALLFLSQGWAPTLIGPRSVEYLLWLSIAFSAVVALYNLGVLRKRALADLLSGANLLCGGFGIAFASAGKIELTLLFALLGAAFDGFDGICARRFGSSRFGVYSDDVADGVNFGLAPGAAIYFTLGGIEGALLGALYAMVTVTRLVFFTLSKSDSDPNYFSGVPSPAGAVATLCTVILFAENPALIGVIVGAVCMQMISFDSQYRHLGRALASHRHGLQGGLLGVTALIAGTALWGPRISAGLILAASLIYGVVPAARRFHEVLSSNGAREQPSKTPVHSRGPSAGSGSIARLRGSTGPR